MITVVIPALNEEGAIARTVGQIRAALDAGAVTDAEILVVDDGSHDRTEQEASKSGARVIRHPHNVGYGRALKAGIRAATHDTIVIIDADLTYPADKIPALLAEYRRGYDMVIGQRTGHQYHGSMFKGPLRWILRGLVEFSAGRKVPDANSGLRIFSRATLLNYIDHLCDTFSFTTSLTLAYMMTGRFVGYIPIEYYERVGETKVKLLWDSMRTIQYILQAIIYYNPMKIFLLMSLACIVLSIASFAVGALSHLNAPYYLGIGGLLLAIVVFALGLLADLLRQIMVK